MEKRVKKTMIGGQALIEGIMMKGPEKSCITVRQPDGELYSEISGTPKNPTRKIPFVRGAVAMVQSLTEGYKYIMKSADVAFPDEAEQEESKFDKWLNQVLGDRAMAVFGTIGAVLGGLLAIALFVLLPTWITALIGRFVALGNWKVVIEGVLKIVIFIAYLFLVTRLKEIHRVFEYHGAEHKTINCYEYGDELTVENVRKRSRFHPRCGTSFIFIVLIVSILVFALIPWGSTLVRTGLKLLALPFIMGISYEIIMFAGKHDNIFCHILSTPGMWVQRLTTFEPDDEEIEVAITAFQAVLPDDGTDAL